MGDNLHKEIDRATGRIALACGELRRAIDALRGVVNTCHNRRQAAACGEGASAPAPEFEAATRYVLGLAEGAYEVLGRAAYESQGHSRHAAKQTEPDGSPKGGE
jgi:hypothetical protein